jgi:class 3 adenylate cyclase
MAFFGAPIALADHAGAAARAALRAMRAVEEQAKQRAVEGLPGLRIRAGINSGEVVVGCIGTRERSEYGIIGHPVNLASRLEEAAGPGEILLGPETRRLLAGRFGTADGGLLKLAGIEEPIPKTVLLSETAAATAR